MQTNPGMQPPPSSTQQGGPRPMTGMRPGAPASNSAVGIAPDGDEWRSTPTMPLPAKRKEYAIATVDPNSGEALNVESIKLAAAPSAEPAAPPPSVTAMLCCLICAQLTLYSR